MPTHWFCDAACRHMNSDSKGACEKCGKLRTEVSCTVALTDLLTDDHVPPSWQFRPSEERVPKSKWTGPAENWVPNPIWERTETIPDSQPGAEEVPHPHFGIIGRIERIYRTLDELLYAGKVQP